MVVIDDKSAFVSGLDPTRSRWDTPEHAAANRLRRDANEQPYQPSHDVHTMFNGDAARAGGVSRGCWTHRSLS
jgi:phospholipase D1/2